MSKGNFAKLLKPLLGIEGGVADRPLKDDPGGLTAFGVTWKVYDAYRTGQGKPTQSVRKITKAEVAEIYEEQYWKPVRGDDLPGGVDWCVFDCAVNSGPGRAVKLLQEVLGCSTDGVIGLNTLKQLAAADPASVIVHYSEARLAFMRKLKNWGANKNGWARRVAEVRAAALDMADPETPEPTSEAIEPVSLPKTATAKAPDAAVAQLKTPGVQGAAAFLTGFTGTQVQEAQSKISPFTNMDTPLGRAAFLVLWGLMGVGALFVVLPWVKAQTRNGAFGGFVGKVFQ